MGAGRSLHERCRFSRKRSEMYALGKPASPPGDGVGTPRFESDEPSARGERPPTAVELRAEKGLDSSRRCLRATVSKVSSSGARTACNPQRLRPAVAPGDFGSGAGCLGRTPRSSTAVASTIVSWSKLPIQATITSLRAGRPIGTNPSAQEPIHLFHTMLGQSPMAWAKPSMDRQAHSPARRWHWPTTAPVWKIGTRWLRSSEDRVSGARCEVGGF